MRRFAYTKIDLNAVPPKGSDLDLLNAAGAEGWRLVLISANDMAYFVREVQEKAPAPKRQRDPKP